MVSDTEVPIYYEDCLGGFELKVKDDDIESMCSCETHDPRVVMCENDQDSIVIEVSTMLIYCICVGYLGQVLYL